MPQEYSAGAVIFHRTGKTIRYLLLRYLSEATGKPGYWGFAKGRIEPGEEIKTTVAREIGEETGSKDLVFISGFEEKNIYFFKRNRQDGKYETIRKEVIFCLVESKTDKVTLSPEHCDFVWLPYEEARERLTHESSREILAKANEKLRDYQPWGIF